MAAPTSPMSLYHSPLASGRSQQRRGSARGSLSTTCSIPSGPQVESPRTLCPRDGDAFSYNPSHLSQWFMPQDLWTRLPHQLQSTLAALQHSGAAVLTGYERLEEHSDSFDDLREHQVVPDELEVKLDDSILSLPSPVPLPTPKLRTTSNASSRFESTSSTPSLASPASSGSSSPTLSSTQALSPMSPFSLTPLDATAPHKQRRGRSFSTPLEPHNAYYATELSQLRTESLPRLRHAARKVDTEWYESKRVGNISAADIVGFEQWWAEKKLHIRNLDGTCKRLSISIGISPCGMGWTAP